MFDATSHKFSDVNFQKIDTSDPSNGDLCQRYDVRSIPRLVFLDNSNGVLYNGGASSQPGAFEELVKQYH